MKFSSALNYTIFKITQCMNNSAQLKTVYKCENAKNTLKMTDNPNPHPRWKNWAGQVVPTHACLAGLFLKPKIVCTSKSKVGKPCTVCFLFKIEEVSTLGHFDWYKFSLKHLWHNQVSHRDPTLYTQKQRGMGQDGPCTWSKREKKTNSVSVLD